MKKTNKNNLIIFAIFAIAILSLGTNIVYAATSAKLAFCDYAGVRRAFKIAGLIIDIVKIVVPLLVIITGMIGFAKPIISGKTEDITANAMILLKKVIAGLVIFLLPGICDYAFSLIPNYDDSSIAACTTCLLDVNGCTIPTTDPITYTE